MPKLKDFRVMLLPCRRDESNPGFLVTEFSFFSGVSYPTLNFPARTTAEVIKVCDEYARAHGEGCRASVRCLSKPKPAHFDRDTKSLTYNIRALTDDEREKIEADRAEIWADAKARLVAEIAAVKEGS